MSLADDLLAAKADHRLGPPCGIAVLLDDLGDDADALRDAIADPALPGTVIARVLRGRGHKVGDSTVQRHRKGECSCPRSQEDA